MSKIKIDFNDFQYTKMLELESKLIGVYEKIKELGEQALGVDKCNMFELLKIDPAQYIVSQYAELYLQDFPPHLDRHHLFTQQANVSLDAITELKSQLDGYALSMGKYKPTINAKGVTSNIKKSDFNIYLNEQKKDHYDALNNLVDAIEKLKNYNAVSQSIHLVRAFPDLLMKNTGVIINTSKFI